MFPMLDVAVEDPGPAAGAMPGDKATGRGGRSARGSHCG
jgi:hypothetical protein